MSKLFILPVNGDCNGLVPVLLKHPKDSSDCVFFVDEQQKCVFELNVKRNEFYSWFVNDLVVNDGDLYVASPIDPLFLIIPFIFNNTANFKSLSDIFYENDIDSSKIQLLEKLYTNETLKCVSKVKSYEDDIFIQFDKVNTIDWLCLKFSKIKASLMKNSFGKNLCGFHVNDYVAGDKKISDDEYNIQTLEILSDYINPQLALELKAKLNIPDKDNLFTSNLKHVGNKRKLEGATNGKTSTTTLDDDCSKDINVKKQDNNKKLKMTRTERMLKKVDKTGMKNIASYFKSKN